MKRFCGFLASKVMQNESKAPVSIVTTVHYLKADLFFFFLHITVRRNIFLLFQFPWRFEETLLQVWIFWGEENISNTAERVTLSFKITEEHSVSFFFAIARIKKIKQHQERQEMRSHAHELCEVRQLFWDIRRSNWLFLLEFLRVNSSWALLLRPN